MQREVLGVLSLQGWLASCTRYPVSAATAYECGLERGASNTRRLREKVTQLVLSKFTHLGKFESGHLTQQVVTQSSLLGPLQAMMLFRYMDIEHTENWTEFSGAYVPVGYTPEALGRALQKRVADVPVLVSLLRSTVPRNQQGWLWEASHVEHEAWEFRKQQDNVGATQE